MHVEPLHPRVLFASTPLDPTFGTAGRAGLENGASRVLATDDAIYVESGLIDGNSTERWISKYTSAGKLVATWGERGHVSVPFEMTQLAYDKRTGLLYAAGDGSGADEAVSIRRYTKTGVLDTAFGTGVTGYTPADSPPGTQSFTHITKILPLAGRQVMVAFDFTLQSGESSDDSVVLVKFRSNGTRDPAFGRRGKITVLGGYDITTRSSQGREGPYAASYSTPHIVDLVEQPNRIRVVITRAQGERSGSDHENSDRADETFQVKLRTVFADGAIEASTAYSWTLLKPDVVAAGNTFQTLVARYDGKDFKHDNVSIVGTVTAFAVSTESAGEVGRSTTEPYKFTLAPGVRTNPVKLDRHLTGISAVFSGSKGVYFASTGTAVKKIAYSAISTTDFADHGIAFLAGDAYAVAADPDGRLLLVSGTDLERIA